jgi:hypothetical protein
MHPTEFRPLLKPLDFLIVYFKMKIKGNGDKHFLVTDQGEVEMR